MTTSDNLLQCVETRDPYRDCASRSLIISSGSVNTAVNGVSTMTTNGAALVIRLMPMMRESDAFDCDITVDVAARYGDDTMRSLTVNGSFRIACENVMRLTAVPDEPRFNYIERVFAELPIVDDRYAWEIDEGVIESEKAFEALYDTNRMIDTPNVWNVCAGILQVCNNTSDTRPYAIKLVTKTHDDVVEWYIPITRDDLRRLAQLMLDWRDQ